MDSKLRTKGLAESSQTPDCRMKKLWMWLPGMDSNHDSRLQRPLSYH